MMRRLAYIPAFVMSAACGEEAVSFEPEPGNPPGTGEPAAEAPLPRPVVRALTPGAAAVGDHLTILGERFIAPPLGTTRARITGTLTTTEGVVHDVDYSVVPAFVRTTVLRTAVTGDAPPHGMGHQTGHFNGSITVVNISRDGEEQEESEPTPVDVDIEPSLIFETVRPVDSGCSGAVSRTTEGELMQVEVRATGLAKPNELRPIRFTYVFMQPGADISLGDAFALSGNTDVPGPHDVASDAAVVVTDIVTSGSRSSLDRGFFSQFWEQGFRTAAVPGELHGYTTSIFVRAEDADGLIVEGRRDFEVVRPMAAEYDGAVRAVRALEPEPVTGCLFGGPRGTSVTYSENESETRSRSYNVGASLELGIGIKKVLDIGFGFNVGGTVSSSEAVGSALNLSGELLPGQYGVFYRQTIELARTGRVFSNGACGGREELGEVVVTDWTWAPDLALSNNDQGCPPFPPSNLESYQASE